MEKNQTRAWRGKPPREDAGRRRVRRARRWARAARLDAVGYDGHERHRADSPSRLKRRARGRGGRKPPPTARCDRAGNPNREDESTAHARARGRMTTDSWGCRRDRHINEHAMNLASVRVRRRVVSPRRRRPRCPAEVPAKIYGARCFAGPDVCRVGRVPCRWSGSTAPGQSRTPARAHPSRCGERSAWLLAIRAGNAQV